MHFGKAVWIAVTNTADWPNVDQALLAKRSLCDIPSPQASGLATLPHAHAPCYPLLAPCRFILAQRSLCDIGQDESSRHESSRHESSEQTGLLVNHPSFTPDLIQKHLL
jgi:hypothetical protein